MARRNLFDDGIPEKSEDQIIEEKIEELMKKQTDESDDIEVDFDDFDFSHQPDRFALKDPNQVFDDDGNQVSGDQYRWVRMDSLNIEHREYQKYRVATDVVAPHSRNPKKGVPQIVERGPEKYLLMKRPLHIKQKHQEQMDRKRATRIDSQIRSNIPLGADTAGDYKIAKRMPERNIKRSR